MRLNFVILCCIYFIQEKTLNEIREVPSFINFVELERKKEAE